jgi:hypothetical protein
MTFSGLAGMSIAKMATPAAAKTASMLTTKTVPAAGAAFVPTAVTGHGAFAR